MNRNECFSPSAVSAISARLAWASLEILSDETEEIQALVSGAELDVADLRIGLAEGVLTVEQPSYGLAPRLTTARWMQVVLRVPRDWKGAVEAGTIAGQMKVRGLNGSDLSFTTVTGALQATDLCGLKIDFRTVSGLLRAAGVETGALSIRSVTGEIRFSGVNAALLRYTTVSGDVRIGCFSAFEKLEGTSVSGDVTLVLPDPALSLSFRTVTGRLRTEGIVQAEQAASDASVTSVSGQLTVQSGLEQLPSGGEA